MLKNLFKRKWPRRQKPISYDEAKVLAADGDEAVRADLAGRTDVAPEILYFLAEDKSAEVRRRIADNAAAPGQADLLLAKDRDDAVRESLAAKIARMAPDLSPGEHDALKRTAYEALTLLAKDQAARVRGILSDALKAMPDAPPDIIRQLAWDAENAVAAPVLRFSPVLTDADLIEIIQAAPSPGAAAAVAERDGVSGDVSAAIVGTDDVQAIGLLLGNASAQIREETLDRVIDRAVDVEAWHVPLADRPGLNSRAATKIARFVADDILRRMAARDDLPADIIQGLRAAVDDRLGGAGPGEARGMHVDDDEAFDEASQLWAEGALDEGAFTAAITRGDDKLAMAMLAVMGDVPMRAVRRCCATNSANGCTALAWQAGLSAKTAELVQRRLGRVKPVDMVHAAHDGAYTLDDADLKWQVDFVRGL